jgi:hypothetical protein
MNFAIAKVIFVYYNIQHKFNMSDETYRKSSAAEGVTLSGSDLPEKTVGGRLSGESRRSGCRR